MEKRDYYAVLGLEKAARPDEVKSAYRKMAMKYHPDRNPGDTDAEDSFKEATEAYEVLKDPNKKSRYDQFGHSGLGQGPSGGFGGGGFEGFDLSDALRAFMRDFGGGGGGGDMGGFEDLFGGGRRAGRVDNRGRDLQVKLKLTLEEIATGTKKKIKVKRLTTCEECSGHGSAPGSSSQTCPQCKGHGQVRRVSRSIFGQMVNVTTCDVCHGAGQIITAPCPACHGEGRKRKSAMINVDIPAGVASGNYIPLEGQGEAGVRGGPAGDLIVVIDEKDHEHFSRQGNNIICQITISFITATLGGTISVPGLDGEIGLNIPAGTQTGKVFKIKGKGIPHLRHRGQGDEMVQVQVWIPKKLNSDEKKLLQKLSNSESFAPPPSSRSFFSRLRDTLGV